MAQRSNASAQARHAREKFTGYQKFVVAMLGFLQFTIILDFMILSPLGAVLIPKLQITPAQFGFVVSAYAFSAGFSGLLAAGFADRFDRKKLLLFFYVGFLGGTLLCGIAPNYSFLVFARMVTGVFGGVIGSIVMAITADLFPFQMRGRVMGIIQSAFAASQVLGIPLGLSLSNAWGWHAPFLMIVGVGAVVGGFVFVYLRPINAHLKLKSESSPLRHLLSTVSRPRYLQGFAATALLSTGGFMLMPLSSAFTVHNIGISLSLLPTIYLATGMSALIAGPIVGRLSDALGSFRVFAVGSIFAIVLVLFYTQLGPSSLATVLGVNALLFIAITSRIISASALVSALPSPADRGSYMAVSNSIQQLAGGLAAAIAGLIVVQDQSGRLQHYDLLGYVFTAATVITAIMMHLIDRYLRMRGLATAAATPSG